MTPPNPEYREIHLTLGQVAIVDAEDYAWLILYKWNAYYDRDTKSYYAVTSLQDKTTGRRYTQGMHRTIMGLQYGDGRMVDHIAGGSTLDNRRSNLRIADASQNQFNSRMRKDNSSGYKGVARYGSLWRAQIRHAGKNRYLGTFATPEAAYAAYCEEARKYRGEFARV